MRKTFQDFWKFQNCGYMILEKNKEDVRVLSTTGLNLINREDLF